MYERLAEVLRDSEEPYEAARAAIEALREPTPEVLNAGISIERWRAAVDAMLSAADSIDQARAQDATAKRQAMWPAIRRELESIGCQLWHCVDDNTVWSVEGPGVQLEVNLNSGEVDGLWIGPLEDPFAQLTSLVREEVAGRSRKLAEDARRKRLRQTHVWSKARKAWVPKDGSGSIIKGGGSAP